MKEYKNACKFGLFVKDLGRIIDINEQFEARMSECIKVLLREHKIIPVERKIKIEKKVEEKKIHKKPENKGTKKEEVKKVVFEEKPALFDKKLEE